MRKVIITLALIVAGWAIKAQNPVIRTMDLELIPKATENPDSNTVYSVSFKIDKIDEASEVFLLFGTAQDLQDVCSTQLTVGFDNGNYYFALQGNQYYVTGIQAAFDIQLTPQQYNDLSVVTLYVTDSNGNNSSSIYFNK